MNHRIQIMVDDKLNKSIKAGAKQMGLSVSSYARLVLMNGLSEKKVGLLQQAIQDVESTQTESISIEEFNNEVDKL